MSIQDPDDHKLPLVNSDVEGVDDTEQQVDGVQGATTSPAVPQAVPVDPALDVADEVDLIEKAWIEKAKDIVASTQGNPHDQNEQMNQVKSDYMKKRYGRDITVGE